MGQFFDTIRRGLGWSLRPLPLLALFLSGLGLGVIQAWPVLILALQGAHQPWIGEVAAGASDGLIALLLAGEGETAATSLLWLAMALGLSLVYAGAYNLISGGALSLWLGVRTFWAGCRANFWSFTGLGIVLLMLAIVALAVATLVGTSFGLGAGFVMALLLLQILNLSGEYARALVVNTQQRNPFTAFGRALTFCLRHPGTLVLGLLGFGLHSALGWLASRSADLPAIVALALGQLWALGWAWLKLLRLAWALAYVNAAYPPITQKDTLVPAVEAV